MHAIDAQAPAVRRATLVVVTSPEIGLEVRRARVLSNHADFETLAMLEKRRYRGRVPQIHVVVQRHLVDNGKAQAMLRMFADVPADAWQSAPHGGFVGYAAVR